MFRGLIDGDTYNKQDPPTKGKTKSKQKKTMKFFNLNEYNIFSYLHNYNRHLFHFFLILNS